MPSTYTQNGGIEKPANGEQTSTWGTTANTDFDIIDRLTNGVGPISLAGTSSTLTTSNGALSNGQYKVLVLSGTPSGTHTITIAPNTAQKFFFVQNNTAQSVIFAQGSGSTVTVPAGKSKIVYSDGAGSAAAVSDLTNTFSMANPAITGGAVSGATITGGTVSGATITGGSISGATISGVATSGPITASGLTQTTSRILGRTTASTGAIEELSLAQTSGLSLLAGTLAGISGHVVRVVTGSTTTEKTITGTAEIDTGLSATITPLSASNKLLVIVHQWYTVEKTNTASTFAGGTGYITLFRDTTYTGAYSGVGTIYGLSTASATYCYTEGSGGLVYLDTAGTTSAITYKTRGSGNNAATKVVFQKTSDPSYIMILELAP